MDFRWSQFVSVPSKHSWMVRLSSSGPATFSTWLPCLPGVGLQSIASPAEVCLHGEPLKSKQVLLPAEFADFCFFFFYTCHIPSISGRYPSISSPELYCPSPRTVPWVLTCPQYLYPWGKWENHQWRPVWGLWRAPGFRLQVPCSQESLYLWLIPEPEKVIWVSVGRLQPSQVSPCGQEHGCPQDVFKEMNIT